MQRIALYTLAFIITVSAFSPVAGQYYFYNEKYQEPALIWEAGFSSGGMNCLTDLGGGKGAGRKFIKDINWNTTKPCGSIFVGATYGYITGARLELSFGQVKANDNILKNDQSSAYTRYIRNLNYRSSIKEIALFIEFNPLLVLGRYERDLPLINPYIFTGIGFFSFNPETYFNNSWQNVTALHTEGQGFAEYQDRKVYKLKQLNLPLGLGIKHEASPVLNFHFEITYRKLWTDYLDDVSKSYIDPVLFQKYFTGAKANMAMKLADRRLTNEPGVSRNPGGIRGNKNNNDAYFSASIKIGFILGR